MYYYRHTQHTSKLRLTIIMAVTTGYYYLYSQAMHSKSIARKIMEQKYVVEVCCKGMVQGYEAEALNRGMAMITIEIAITMTQNALIALKLKLFSLVLAITP